MAIIVSPTMRLAARRFHVQRVAYMQTSAIRQAFGESDVHKDSSKRAQEVEGHKQDQLKAQEQGKGEWKPALGTDSEGAVKADRGEVKHSKEDTEQLQKETADAAAEKHGQK